MQGTSYIHRDTCKPIRSMYIVTKRDSVTKIFMQTHIQHTECLDCDVLIEMLSQHYNHSKRKHIICLYSWDCLVTIYPIR